MKKMGRGVGPRPVLMLWTNRESAARGHRKRINALAVFSYIVQAVEVDLGGVGASAAIDAVINSVVGANLIVPDPSPDGVTRPEGFIGYGIDVVRPLTADERIAATITVDSIVVRSAVQLIVAIWCSGGLAKRRAVPHHMIEAAAAVNYVASAKAEYVLIVVTTFDPIVLVGTHTLWITRAGNGGSKRHSPCYDKGEHHGGQQQQWASHESTTFL
jgi:hypothetical protein